MEEIVKELGMALLYMGTGFALLVLVFLFLKGDGVLGRIVLALPSLLVSVLNGIQIGRAHV